MKFDQPNAAQKRWREAVRNLGSIISGGPAEIHHCAGRTAVHNKIHVGHWWILPLSHAEHMALHEAPDRKAQEKLLFTRTCMFYIFSRPPNLKNLPFDDTVTNAIQDYHK